MGCTNVAPSLFLRFEERKPYSSRETSSPSHKTTAGRGALCSSSGGRGVSEADLSPAREAYLNPTISIPPYSGSSAEPIRVGVATWGVYKGSGDRCDFRLQYNPQVTKHSTCSESSTKSLREIQTDTPSSETQPTQNPKGAIPSRKHDCRHRSTYGSSRRS
jgi:hypothetical protein